MCGIVCAFNIQNNSPTFRTQVLTMAKKIRHRGPDWSGIFSSSDAILAHERLSIVDPKSGKQPIYSDDNELVLSVNGEIYNHLTFRKEFSNTYQFRSKSDCEVILPLFKKYGPKFIDKLNGIFSFAIYNIISKEYFIARDHLGIVPLYMGWDDQDRFFISSEMKALEGYCKKIKIFPPGSYFYSNEGKLNRWYKPTWNISETIDKDKEIIQIKESLENAVHAQLMTDVPYGVLLSGGLDSSLIASITNKFVNKRIETNDQKQAWWPRLHSFSVGLAGSPDLKAAKIVADYLNTVHHEIIITIQEGLDALEEVIYSLETYDVTTIRAATPMYLMSRLIKSMGIKMVLSGEGADEIFGGYLYFHKAPNPREFHEETVRKLNKLHLYDCLRANKSMAAWGVEARVPFLDKNFIDIAMSINPKKKMITKERIEKDILRKAFKGYLPDQILYRQKEQFSDGVGYAWIDTLKSITEENVSDKDLINADSLFPINTPQIKEEYYYRRIFSKFYKSDSAALTVPSIPSVACSTEIALKWDKSFNNLNDPSGRTLKSIHQSHYSNDLK